MRRQLHALRDALALAVVLNRTLVLPQFDCVCDRSELVDFVPSCTFPGAPPPCPFPQTRAPPPLPRRSHWCSVALGVRFAIAGFEGSTRLT